VGKKGFREIFKEVCAVLGVAICIFIGRSSVTRDPKSGSDLRGVDFDSCVINT
jgi:hypothetical protein